MFQFVILLIHVMVLSILIKCTFNVGDNKPKRPNIYQRPNFQLLVGGKSSICNDASGHDWMAFILLGACNKP